MAELRPSDLRLLLDLQARVERLERSDRRQTWDVRDTAGVLRTRVGLQADGTFGFRMQDAAGNPLAVDPSGASVRTVGGAQALTNGGWVGYTQVGTAGAAWNRGPMYAAGLPDRITFPVAGLYLVHVFYAFAANASGERGVGFLFNGGGPYQADQRSPTPGGLCTGSFVEVYPVAAGDVVGVAATHNITGGGTLSFTADLSAVLLTR